MPTRDVALPETVLPLALPARNSDRQPVSFLTWSEGSDTRHTPARLRSQPASIGQATGTSSPQLSAPLAGLVTYTGGMSKQYSAPPSTMVDSSKKYTATFDTTRGSVVVDLFAKDAPKTVSNFVFLARDGFYDGTVFHRVIPKFMVQGGDPTGTGTGGPGYKFEDETKGNPNKHKRGTLSMANAGPNTNGSQFFITHVVTDWLDGKHTVFGEVRSGQDVVDSIKQGDKLNAVKVEEA